MVNLERMELGLLDQLSPHRSVQSIAALFRALLCCGQDEDIDLKFTRLEMLSIDFCPTAHSNGDNDHEALHRVVAEAASGRSLGGLTWITLCGAQQDRIYHGSTENAVNIE